MRQREEVQEMLFVSDSHPCGCPFDWSKSKNRDDKSRIVLFCGLLMASTSTGEQDIGNKLFRMWAVCLLLICSSATADTADLAFAPDGSFTIAVIPDTQAYLGRDTKSEPNSTEQVRNDVFDSITKWIVQHRDEQNIVFVSHVGDIVDKNVPEQWAVARSCMDRIHGLIPYGMTVGNHDMVRTGDSSLFQEYFGESHYETFDWYGGAFYPEHAGLAVSGNNANSYQLLTLKGLDFIFFHLECNAPDDVLAWVDDVISRHADRRVCITTHMDLGPMLRPKTNDGYISDPKGRMQWKKCHSDRGNTPVQMWDKCFKHHKNLFLICSGDQSRTQAMHLAELGVHGNVVHSCLTDYGSDGSLRLYRFTPTENRVDAITYNVIHNQLSRRSRYVADEKEHQFSFDYSMRQ